MAQHYTGILFQWIKENKPEFIPRLRKLVESGQIEMMTGGFYEPIMSVIPEKDKVGQIRKLTQYVKNETGYDARGMWLAERIWEPHLPKPCTEAGVKYLVLDDSHFKNSGLKEEELRGYFVTEEEGKTIFLFPISESLRYTIPFQPPEKTIEFLRSAASEDGQNLVVFADDGEKFGVWPETYEHCYEDKWLQRFFDELKKNSDWINIIHLSEVFSKIKPLGRIYLPTASYREMMEWAMPTKAIKAYEQFEDILKEQELHEKYKVFVRGGFWRNFMAKYPESNNMHKKMMHLNRRLRELENNDSMNDDLKKAEDLIWAGQCNCPYWHGVFGGLYLNHLRYATYHRFLLAEKILDAHEQAGSRSWLRSSVEDFDGDGQDEILISNSKLNLYFSPENGGSLFELDFKPNAINLLDTMTRREESYHHKLLEYARKNDEKAEENGAGDDEHVASIHDIVQVKEEGLDKLLYYDWYRRTALLDHFLKPGTHVEEMHESSYEELGDFVDQPFEFAMEKSGQAVQLKLHRHGGLYIDGERTPVYLEKNIGLSADSSDVNIDILIKNLSGNEQDFFYAAEFNFALLAGDAPDRNYIFPDQDLDDSRLCSIGEMDNVDSVQLVDEWLKVKVAVNLQTPASIWRFPIETISQSEAGFERVYQNSVVLPNWKYRLSPDEVWRAAITLKLSEL